MDRRLFLQYTLAAGVLGNATCAGGEESPRGDTPDTSTPPDTPTHPPPTAPGQRDWASLARVDMKPPRPIDSHIRAVAGAAMVSTDHPYATEAALWALERGGTAADAYITASLAQCVLEPAMTTLGGGFGVTFFDAAAGELSTAGSGFAFPSGTPATEPWDQARSWTGFVIDHVLWGYLHHGRKMVGRFAGPGRDNWFRDGYLPGVGDTVHLPELAATMTRLREEGGDYFYTGPFAQRLVDEVARRGGGITMEDLAGMGGFVSPAWKSGEPGGVPYRGYEIAPSSGLLAPSPALPPRPAAS